MDPIRITHFSDVLCAWAYVSQIRIDELKEKMGGKIAVDYHFLNAFGSTAHLFEDRWGDKGGAEGYAEHVREILSKFDHVTPHKQVWSKTIPRSSMPCHLFLCAIRTLESREEIPAGSLEKNAWALREAFFTGLVDISSRRIQLNVAGRLGLPIPRIEEVMDDGTASAALSEDLLLARENDIRTSPTFLFNEGRQKLAGNVGYRILEVNVRELIDRPGEQQSWC